MTFFFPSRFSTNLMWQQAAHTGIYCQCLTSKKTEKNRPGAVTVTWSVTMLICLT